MKVPMLVLVELDGGMVLRVAQGTLQDQRHLNQAMLEDLATTTKGLVGEVVEVVAPSPDQMREYIDRKVETLSGMAVSTPWNRPQRTVWPEG